jgi:chromosome segregation and condensation protein ScpB
MARARKPAGELDLELEDLPTPARWREWMGRVEAVIFASPEPVLRESLARVVGKACNLDLVIDDIRDELSGRPYEIVSVAGGWSFRTKLGFGDAIRTALGGPTRTELSKSNALVLMAIAYFQPITRGELSQFLGREVSRDAIASLRGEGSSPPGCAARRQARLTPMSRRRGFWRNSAWRASATCRTSRNSGTRGCLVERAGTCSTARLCGESWG